MREKIVEALAHVADASRVAGGAAWEANNNTTPPGLKVGLDAAWADISSAHEHLLACLRIMDREPSPLPIRRVSWEEFEAAFRRLYQRD